MSNKKHDMLSGDFKCQYCNETVFIDLFWDGLPIHASCFEKVRNKK